MNAFLIDAVPEYDFTDKPETVGLGLLVTIETRSSVFIVAILTIDTSEELITETLFVGAVNWNDERST